MATGDKVFSADSDLRLLVIGRTGHGKSSTCNSIIGRKKFEVSATSTSTTETCGWQRERNVEVVDTPGIFDTDRHNSKIHKELIKSLLLTTPGFHAIAFVLMRGKFTEEIQKTKDLFFEWFGQDVEKFSFVILTDTNNKRETQEFLQNKPHPKLTELIQQCGRRVVPLQNAECGRRLRAEQVSDILKMAENIKAKNKNACFSNVAFKLAESYAKNKDGIFSPASIRLLSQAGLTQSLTRTQRNCLSETIQTIGVSANQNRASSGNLEANMTTASKRHEGNLRMFDNTTNEPLYNTDTIREQTKEDDSSFSSNKKIETKQYNDFVFDDIRNETPKPSSRTGRIIDIRTFKVKLPSVEDSLSVMRTEESQSEEQPLIVESNVGSGFSRAPVTADSDAPDSIEHLKIVLILTKMIKK